MNVIELNDISKKYMITHSGGVYMTLREEIMSQFFSHAVRESFFALKNISLTIQKGDIVGIIGKNGSGKSTLLKILSRITSPTSGTVRIQGRVMSLLEVGTGFHPELSGRENIFLNGAILGLHRSEINKVFNDIVAFAGIEKFLDTPLKKYSSGMGIRLGFSVAVHLNPDILIIDEVLSVGDAEFQQKSLQKIKELVASKDRTVLFVSHNFQSIADLCTKALVLNEGEVVYRGTAQEAVAFYKTIH